MAAPSLYRTAADIVRANPVLPSGIALTALSAVQIAPRSGAYAMTPPDLASLAAQIIASTDGRPVETRLATSQRIIARVTDGIYREPWAAFRELVANAYDADAHHVVIETGAPAFELVTVRDDGIGMSPETLAYILHNIGGSSKRTPSGAEFTTTDPNAPDRSPGGRLLIGKIGIGLFAVAQLTQHFQIITKTRGSKLRVSATVKLSTHDDDVYTSSTTSYDAGRVKIKAETVADSEVHTHGTTVVLYSLRPEVRRTLQSVQRWATALDAAETGHVARDLPFYHIGHSAITNANVGDPRPPNLPWQASDSPEHKFEMLFQAARAVSGRGRKTANLELFDEYLQLVWKLSLSLPIGYMDGHPFDTAGASGLLLFNLPPYPRQAEALSLHRAATLRDELELTAGHAEGQSSFSVTLDGIALRRPVRLPVQLEKKSRLKAPALMVAKQGNPFQPTQLKRAGGPLSFEAYLYWNSQILPKETTGVLIRIREASGTLFDPTFLNYRVSEQTRLRQITAEIFVHDGLDSALNIDRESFNYSHPHFLYLQHWLHRALRVLINRIKSIASKDLDEEKAQRRLDTKMARYRHAEQVWLRRHGQESDVPALEANKTLFPEEIGGTELVWPSGADRAPIDRVTAAAVVLEAYGALSSLPQADRSDLILDLVDSFLIDE